MPNPWMLSEVEQQHRARAREFAVGRAMELVSAVRELAGADETTLLMVGEGHLPQRLAVILDDLWMSELLVADLAAVMMTDSEWRGVIQTMLTDLRFAARVAGDKEVCEPVRFMAAVFTQAALAAHQLMIQKNGCELPN